LKINPLKTKMILHIKIPFVSHWKHSVRQLDQLVRGHSRV